MGAGASAKYSVLDSIFEEADEEADEVHLTDLANAGKIDEFDDLEADEAHLTDFANAGKIVEFDDMEEADEARLKDLANTGKIAEFYDMETKPFPENTSYSSVYRATSKSTGDPRAVKSICKARVDTAAKLKREITIMKMMDHPNIIKLHETFEDHRHVHLVTELCTGGELRERIVEAGHFTEVQAAIVFQQILHVTFYMHMNHICHRDLRPEYFWFEGEESLEKASIKLVDFDLSCKFKPGQVLTTRAGTPYYTAPQVLAGEYNHLCDLWSCGVILYVMLCGYPPFFGETDAEVLSKVRLGNYSFSSADWKDVSEDAKNLIRGLLTMNPRDRYTAEQALNHDWIKLKASKATDAPLQSGLVDNLKGVFRDHWEAGGFASRLPGVAGKRQDEGARGCTRASEALTGQMEEALRWES